MKFWETLDILSEGWRNCSSPDVVVLVECVMYVRMCDVCENVWRMSECVMYVRMCDVCENVWHMSECVMYDRMCDVCQNVWCMSECVMYVRMCDVCQNVWCMSECVMYVRMNCSHYTSANKERTLHVKLTHWNSTVTSARRSRTNKSTAGLPTTPYNFIFIVWDTQRKTRTAEY